LDIFARTLVVWWCGKALAQLEKGRLQLEKADSATTGNSLLDMTSALKRGSDNYFESYFKYQRIVDSWTYSFLQFLTFVTLLWGGFGLWVTVHDVIMDSLACDAKFALKYMHVYAFFYVVLLTWNIITLVLTIVGYLSGSKLVSNPILNAAKSFDDDSMQGIPLALTLVESFVLKNSTSALSMSQREVKSDMRRLNDKLEVMDLKLKHKRLTSDRMSRVAGDTKTQEEYMDRYQTLMNESFEQAKPLVGLLAANVTTADEVSDPSAIDKIAAIKMRVSTRRQTKGLRKLPSTVEEELEEDAEEVKAADVDSF